MRELRAAAQPIGAERLRVHALERLVDFLAEHYRWGLHPLKLIMALVAPVLVVWLADRRARVLAENVEEEDARIHRLPRIRRR